MALPHHRLLTALVLSLGVAGAALVAQAPPSQQPPQQQPPPPRPPVFRAGSVLVTVDVYPQRDGKLVEGLSTEDFQVLEDGKPQAIDSLELVRVERARSDAERRDPNSTRDMWVEAADPKNRVFVVYLDTLHVTVDGSHNIRRPLVDMLNSLIAPNDLFGVMTPAAQARHLSLSRLTQSIEEQLSKYWAWGERHRTTDDATDLVEGALKRCYEFVPLQPGMKDPLKERIVDDEGSLRPLYQILIDRRREDKVMTSFEDLVVFLTNRREARTVIVLVSDGWRLFRPDRRLLDQVQRDRVPEAMWTGRVTRPDLERTSNPAVCDQELARLAELDNAQRFRNFLMQANRTNISVYAVTPSGLTVWDTPIHLQPKPADPIRGSRLEIDAKLLRSRIESLQTIAENTDGLAIVKTNDIAGGLKRIVDDVSAYYLLTYYSTNTKNDGGFRRIEVRTKRPGLSIRARRGYQAPNENAAAARAPSAPAATAPIADVLVDAVFGPLSRLRPGAELFTYGAIRGDRLLVSVELGSGQLVNGPFAKGADLTVAAVAEVGTSRSGVTVNDRLEAGVRGKLVVLTMPPASGSGQGVVTPVPWHVTVTISAGPDRLQERFELKASRSRLIGDPIPFRATPAATSPLRPVADFLYRRTERVHIEWPLLGPVDRREARLIARNGQRVALPVTLTERDDNGQTVIAADVSLAPLAAAEYAIELVVSQGANSERRYVAFRVTQ